MHTRWASVKAQIGAEGLAPDRNEQSQRTGTGLEPLVREWLIDLKVSPHPKTIAWYAQKMDWYLRSGGAIRLEQLTASEVKSNLADLHGRGLGDAAGDSGGFAAAGRSNPAGDRHACGGRIEEDPQHRL